jgi:hypothetical protein
MATVGDVYSAKVVCRNTASAFNPIVSINVLHYEVIAVTGTGKFDQDIADRVDLELGAPYKGILTPDSGYRGVIIQKIFPLPMSLPIDSIVSQGPGTRAAGDTLPGQVCGIITKRTSGAGRAKRGRLYVPFPGEDDSTDGLPNAGYITAINTLLTPLVNSLVVGIGADTVTIQPVIFHRAAPGTSDAITFTQSRLYFATQRRRGEVNGPDVSPL